MTGALVSINNEKVNVCLCGREGRPCLDLRDRHRIWPVGLCRKYKCVFERV